jgi:hypothetical protein
MGKLLTGIRRRYPHGLEVIKASPGKRYLRSSQHPWGFFPDYED